MDASILATVSGTKLSSATGISEPSYKYPSMVKPSPICLPRAASAYPSPTVQASLMSYAKPILKLSSLSSKLDALSVIAVP